MIVEYLPTFALDRVCAIAILVISQTQTMKRVLEPSVLDVTTTTIVFREPFVKIIRFVRAKKNTRICRMISGLVTVSYKTFT